MLAGALFDRRHAMHRQSVASQNDGTGEATREGRMSWRGIEAAGPGLPKHSLRYIVEITHIITSGSRYNLIRHNGEGRRYRITVDGKHAAIYSSEPY